MEKATPGKKQKTKNPPRIHQHVVPVLQRNALKNHASDYVPHSLVAVAITTSNSGWLPLIKVPKASFQVLIAGTCMQALFMRGGLCMVQAYAPCDVLLPLRVSYAKCQVKIGNNV